MLGGPFKDVFGRVVRPDVPAGAVFKSDAQVFLSDRLLALLLECEAAKGRGELQDNPDFEQLIDTIQPITKFGKSPHPYVSTIVADGDRMGAALRKLTEPETLRQFSKGLSQFADAAKQIVEQQCMGSLLYAGGDDVVGFVPLETAIACAEGLRKAFADLMTPGNALPGDWPANDPEYPIPTLSAGISVGHVLSGMGTLLEGGRIAERLAKGSELPADKQRNALAIRVDKRSGGVLSWRAQWTDATAVGCPVRRLRDAMQRVSSGASQCLLPATKLAEVRRDLQRFPSAADVPAEQQVHWAGILRLDFLRTLGRAARGLQAADSQPDSTQQSRQTIEQRFGISLSATNYKDCRGAIENWIALHLIAKELVRGQVAESRQADLTLERGDA
jgi:CRISPR-associated protein Cmr2